MSLSWHSADGKVDDQGGYLVCEDCKQMIEGTQRMTFTETSPRPMIGRSILVLPLTAYCSLLTVSCGDKTKCEGKAGGLSALEVINPTDCDLNVMVDYGRLVYVPAKGTACQENLGDAPLTGDHTIQAIKNGSTVSRPLHSLRDAE